MDFEDTNYYYDEWEIHRSNEDSEIDSEEESEAERKSRIERKREREIKRKIEREARKDKITWDILNNSIDYDSYIEIDKEVLYSPLREYMYGLIEKTYRDKVIPLTRSGKIALCKEKLSKLWDLRNDIKYKNSDIISDLYDVNESNMTEIDTYVKLLLTYNKYNKLNVLKNKTKLNNDIIFDIIIKYL